MALSSAFCLAAPRREALLESHLLVGLEPQGGLLAERSRQRVLLESHPPAVELDEGDLAGAVAVHFPHA